MNRHQRSGGAGAVILGAWGQLLAISNWSWRLDSCSSWSAWGSFVTIRNQQYWNDVQNNWIISLPYYLSHAVYTISVFVYCLIWVLTSTQKKEGTLKYWTETRGSEYPQINKAIYGIFTSHPPYNVYLLLKCFLHGYMGDSRIPVSSRLTCEGKGTA